MTTTIFPVILAGGSGTRLWPLSRKNFPKQFLSLHGESSLLQQTVKRAIALPHEKLLVVSNEAHYFLCQEQLQPYTSEINYLLEPCIKNTAPAIAAAAHYIKSIAGPDAVMLVLPSDHWITNEDAFQQAMRKGCEYAATTEALVTFGIQPTSPKTGYGYIEASSMVSDGLFNVRVFREKPDLKTAEAYIAQGHFYWNSGMFAFKAQSYLTELNKYALSTYENSELAVINAKPHNDYLRLNSEAFSLCIEESID